MPKKIWASLDDYLPPGPEIGFVGRNVANHNFIKALLRYGHFDEYHFFLANRAHRRLFLDRHGPYLDAIGAKHKVKTFDRLELPAQIQKEDYVVFHQSDPIAYFNSLCHLRNQMGSFPVTSFIHSLSYQSFMSKYLEMIVGGVTSRDFLICSSVSGRTVLNNCFQQIATRMKMDPPPVQMEVIPLGLEISDFPAFDPKEARARLGLAEDEVIGLYLGRFSDYDKMDLFPLLQAFQRIQGSSSRLLLAGAVQSESYFKILEVWIKTLGLTDRVTMFSNPSAEDKAWLYRAADFFVSPSDNPQETFGLTLLEAMACGLPLIVSDYDGYRELVTAEIGRRVPTTWCRCEPLVTLGPLMDEPTLHRYLAQALAVDTDELVLALEFFFTHPEHCRAMGATAREIFLKNYEYQRVISRLEELWEKAKETSSADVRKSAPDPLAMDIFHCFGHYASRMLSMETIVQLTEFGERFLSPGWQYPLLGEMANLIDYEEARRIMRRLTSPTPVGNIVRQDDSSWKNQYLIAWMLKHDLIKIHRTKS